MNAPSPIDLTKTNNDAARRRLGSVKGEPLLLADWERALFIHYEVEAEVLQAEIPFPLDLRGGRAYVSLVAFTMRRLRPRVGGRLTEWCFEPMATHELLNLRTYVRHGGEAGIYFLAEWIPNRLSAFLGPRTFGLPYRLGLLDYHHYHEQSTWRGRVESVPGPSRGATTSGSKADFTGDRSPRLIYNAELIAPNAFHPCPAGSLDEFLLERYTAFTLQGSKSRLFRIWHPPWPQIPIQVSLREDSLLRGASWCLREAKLVGANYSPGVQNVWLGRPHRVEVCNEHQSVLSAFFEMP